MSGIILFSFCFFFFFADKKKARTNPGVIDSFECHCSNGRFQPSARTNQ